MAPSPDSANAYLKLVVVSSFSELEKVVDSTHDFFAACVSNEELLHKVMLLTSEAVTNAIKHGNKLETGKSVEIEFYNKGASVEVWVEDEGEGFEREAIPDPLADEHLMDTGGRGIFLIEELADEVLYENHGRRVGMLFRL